MLEKLGCNSFENVKCLEVKTFGKFIWRVKEDKIQECFSYFTHQTALCFFSILSYVFLNDTASNSFHNSIAYFAPSEYHIKFKYCFVSCK